MAGLAVLPDLAQRGTQRIHVLRCVVHRRGRVRLELLDRLFEAVAVAPDIRAGKRGGVLAALLLRCSMFLLALFHPLYLIDSYAYTSVNWYWFHLSMIVTVSSGGGGRVTSPTPFSHNCRASQ